MRGRTLGESVRALREQRKREWAEADARDAKLQSALRSIRREPPRERQDELADAGIDWLGPTP